MTGWDAAFLVALVMFCAAAAWITVIVMQRRQVPREYVDAVTAHVRANLQGHVAHNRDAGLFVLFDDVDGVRHEFQLDEPAESTIIVCVERRGCSLDDNDTARDVWDGKPCIVGLDYYVDEHGDVSLNIGHWPNGEDWEIAAEYPHIPS